MLKYEITESSVLPEILVILDEMLRLYNTWEAPVYLKLWPTNVTSGASTSSRYEAYSSKDKLLEAIFANCPTGVTLIQD